MFNKLGGDDGIMKYVGKFGGILKTINKSINEAVRIALDKHLKGGSVYYSSSDEEEPKKKGRGRPKTIKLT